MQPNGLKSGPRFSPVSWENQGETGHGFWVKNTLFWGINTPVFRGFYSPLIGEILTYGRLAPSQRAAVEIILKGVKMTTFR